MLHNLGASSSGEGRLTLICRTRLCRHCAERHSIRGKTVLTPTENCRSRLVKVQSVAKLAVPKYFEEASSWVNGREGHWTVQVEIMKQLFTLYPATQNEFKRFARGSGAPQFGRPRRRRSAAGFTLIEIMVALVIFVFGALAIVRIFPGALAVVQTSETRAIATRMAQATLARFESQPFSVPEAIYDYDSAFPITIGNFSDFNGAVVGTASRNDSLPREPARFEDGDLPTGNPTYSGTGSRFAISRTALGRFRRVTGETKRVALSGPSATANRYITTRFPYSSGGFALHRDHEIEGLRIGASNGTFDFSDAIIAGDPNSIGDPADSQRPRTPYQNATLTYYISYRYILNNRIHGVVDEPIRFTPASPAAPVQALQGTLPGRQIVEGPIKARLREPITSPTFIQNNADRGYVNLGTASFTVVTTDLVDAGDLIGVDYVVSDWRWLVADDAPTEQTEVTPTTTGAILRVMRLPTKYVSDEPSGTETLHALILGRDLANRPIPPLTGSWTAGAMANPQGESPGTQPGCVEFLNQKTGRVLLNINYDPVTPTPLTAPRARVVYRNLDGSGHQLAVAAQSYVPFEPGAPYGTDHPRQPWREYFHNNAPQDRFLYFHPSEAGKSVMVSYEYSDVDPSGNTVYRTVTNAVVTINDELRTLAQTKTPVDSGFTLQAHTASGAVQTNRVAVAELTTLNGELIGPQSSDGGEVVSANARVTAITSIKGVSVRARTAWFEGQRYSQATVSGYRPTD